MQDYSGPSAERLEYEVEWKGYCKSCQGLFNTVSFHNFKHLARELSTNYSGYLHHWGAGCTMCARIRELAGIKDEAFDKGYVHLRAFTEEDSPAAHYFPLRPPHTDNFNARVVEDMKLAIHTCEKSHENCSHFTGKPLLPTRVVWVGGAAKTFKIYEPKVAERDEYVALSYCWGNVTSFCATTENIDNLKAGADVSLLPQTLQDAVEVTRSLGYSYIWIDSICILQDSLADKDCEIARMSGIYRDATVTIAAAVPEGCHEGFLRTTLIPSTKVSIPLGSIRRNGEIHLAIEPENTNINALPLCSRGWSFQEFYLSRRLLIYSKDEVLWHCKATQLTPVRRSIFKTSGTFTTLKSAVVPSDMVLYDHQCRAWRSIVEKYTARALTYPEDRSRAIQGVVDELQLVWQADYAFGIWKNAWLECLTWVRGVPVPPSQRRSQRAPSWSWLSVDYPVSFMTSGKLEIYDAQRCVFCSQVPGDKEPTILGPNSILCFQARLIPSRILDREFWGDHFTNGKLRITCDFDSESCTAPYCVILAWSNETWYHEIRVYYILVSNVRGNVYQRIGARSFEFAHEAWKRLYVKYPRQEIFLC